jgi:8-amino-7-oxononanoate synthase
MVDDAHGSGVLGANGAGSCEYFNCSQEDVPVLMGTFGKALGGSGAFVAGSSALIELLIQFGRSYIYTTALPPAQVAATREALRVIQEEPALRQQLNARIRQFRRGAEELGLPLMQSETAIQPLLLGDEAKALRYSEALRERGCWVTAIREPTVARGQARLRITLTAVHSEEQVDKLLAALAELA